jgi:hypothetical protein
MLGRDLIKTKPAYHASLSFARSSGTNKLECCLLPIDPSLQR